MIDLMKDFAVFILSHNRAENIDTLDMLKKTKYSGKYYVVISTDDHQISRYKELIAPENLLIFDKDSINVDSMTPSSNKKRNSPLYARQYICNYVRNNTNYKYFLMADDDIKQVVHKVNNNGRMKNIVVNDINPIFIYFIQFLCCSDNLAGVSPSYGAGFIGGIKDILKVGRDCFQFVFFKTSKIKDYVGFREEDTLLSLINFEYIYIRFCGMAKVTPIMGRGVGGNEYKEKEFPPSLFPFIVRPSGIKPIAFMRRKRFNKFCYPKIIREQYKKK